MLKYYARQRLGCVIDAKQILQELSENRVNATAVDLELLIEKLNHLAERMDKDAEILR